MKRVIRGSSNISKSIDWDDLIPYEHSFEVDWQSAPNPTCSDDVLKIANECNCLRLTIPTRGFYTHRIYVCKDVNDYENFKTQLRNSRIADLFRISNIKDFNLDDVLALMKEKWDSHVSSQHTKRDGTLSKKTKQYLIRFYLPEIQVDDYFNGSIRIPMPLPEDFIKSATNINSTLWSQLNGTEQSAAECAIYEIQNNNMSIEDAVSYGCNLYSGGNAEPEYEDEDFYEEEANYNKVFKYVESYINNI